MDKVDISIQCKICLKYHTIKVNHMKYTNYRLGRIPGLIQNIFPENTPEERELILSNICPACWDRMFSEEGEGEDDSEIFL